MIVADIVQELERRVREGGCFRRYFTPNTRALYVKHLEFFRAGKENRQRLFMAANRTGKSVAAGCELVYHITGLYPEWWDGYRFSTCSQWWVVGTSAETVRQILQPLLLGPIGSFGTGLIPHHLLDWESLKDAKKAATGVSSFRVRHVNGTYSTVEFKADEQGRRAFEGTERSIWIDEEVSYDTYSECLLRTMTGSNILMATFTPLRGLTEVVLSFLQGADVMSEGQTGLSKYVVRCTWDDAAHLTERDKAELIDSIPPFQREARSLGVPQLGAGAIYPVPESDFIIEPFELPKHWPRCYGFDVGRNTAAVWLAHDRDTGMLYTYSDHFQVEGAPSSHAQGIQARGKWIRGAIDTSAHARSPTDGEHLYEMYIELGLKILNADKAVEAGIFDVLELLQAGKLKVFNTCTGLIEEFRLYHRDEKGRIVKKFDHRLDAWRYAVHTRQKILRNEAEAIEPPIELEHLYTPEGANSWLLS